MKTTFSLAFSLIELIVVIVIISILVSITIVKLIDLQPISDRAAAMNLRANLTYIRNMAMNQERAMRVRFDIASNSYDIYTAVSNWDGNYTPASDPVTRNPWVMDIGKKYSGAALSSVNINGNSTLYFSETNGAPFDSGFAPLTSSGTVTFTSGRMVSIVPETGYANLLE
jgi:prepilin-type N-terminal cleavage/methylation domain-containing protein